MCATCRKRSEAKNCIWEAVSASQNGKYPRDRVSEQSVTSNAQETSYPLVRFSGPNSYDPQIESAEVNLEVSEAQVPGRVIATRVDRAPEYRDRSVHAIIGAVADEENEEGFFGTSSAGAFMHLVKRMVEQRLAGGQSESPDSYRTQTAGPRLVPNDGKRTRQHDYVLPTRAKANGLMSVYWRYVHMLYPYLDKDQMQEDYEKLWTGTGSISDERSFMCLLNSMFALSSQLDSSIVPRERGRSAAVFYERARELLDLTEKASVRSVISYLLLGQYFESTNEPQPCWIFVGFAIRTAQSLGLHLPGTSERVADTKTREMLRKVWHGCVMMDRTVSMLYGRPTLVGPRTPALVPLPSPLEDAFISPLRPASENETATAQQTPVLDFYVFSAKLYEIMHDVAFNFVSIDIEESQLTEGIGEKYLLHTATSEHQPSVFEVEQRLSAWERMLPSHLKIGSDPQTSDTESVVHRQAVVVHQRYVRTTRSAYEDALFANRTSRQLHVRFLMLRPVLSHFATIDARESGSISLGRLLSYRISLQCAIVCVKVAQEAINTIWNNKGRNIYDAGNSSAWWYNILYLYTSATALIAARLSHSVLAEISEDSIVADCYKALELLEGYSELGTSVHRLATTLRLLFDTVPQQYSRLRQNPRESQSQAEASGAPVDDVLLPSMWRPASPTGFLASASFDEPSESRANPELGTVTTGDFSAFDNIFDPNDLSWLMTVPFNS